MTGCQVFGLTSKAKMEKTIVGMLIRQKVINRFFGFGLRRGESDKLQDLSEKGGVR